MRVCVCVTREQETKSAMWKSQMFANTMQFNAKMLEIFVYQLMLLTVAAFLRSLFADLSGKDTRVFPTTRHFLSCSIVILYVFCSVHCTLHGTCVNLSFVRHSFCYHFWFLTYFAFEFTTFSCVSWISSIRFIEIQNMILHTSSEKEKERKKEKVKWTKEFLVFKHLFCNAFERLTNLNAN